MNTIKHLQRLNFQTKPENKIDFHLHQCRLFTDIVFESKNEKFFLHKCQLFAFASIVKFLNIICTKINEAEYLVKDDYSTNFKKAIQTIYSNTITLEQKLKILNETFHLHLLILQEDLDLEARFEFQMNDYTDCLIVTGGVNQYISVNKFYLSQYPFFRILFTSNFGDSTTNKFNFTNEFKDDELNLKNLFLNFTFKGEINPTLLSNTKVKTLIQFYKLGNFLGSDEICYFINWYFYNIFCLCSHCIRNSLKILKFLHHNTLIDSRQNNFFDLKNIYMKILTKKIRLSAILENKTFISEISSYKGSFFSLELKNKKDGEKNFVALLYIIERQDKELRIDIGSLLFDLIFFELNSLTPGNIIKRYIAISRVKCENKGWQASIQFVLRGEMEFLIVNNFEFIYSSALDFKLQLLDHGFDGENRCELILDCLLKNMQQRNCLRYFSFFSKIMILLNEKKSKNLNLINEKRILIMKYISKNYLNLFGTNMNSNKGWRKKRENSKSAFNDQTKFYKENIWVGLYEAQKEFRYKDLERKFLLEIIDFIPTVTSAEELLSL